MPLTTGKSDILPEPRRLSAYDAACRRCAAPRRVPRRGQGTPPGVLLPAGAAVRRGRRAARRRRPRAGHARRQRDRAAVHRRPRGHPAVRDAARLRLRVAAHGRRGRRRPGAAGLPDHQRGQVPAAGEQAARRPRSATCNDFLARGPRDDCPPAARSSRSGRIAHDATLRALGRRRRRVRARRAARARSRHRAVRQLPLQPLQHQHAPADAGDVRRGVRRRRAASRAPARRAQPGSASATPHVARPVRG